MEPLEAAEWVISMEGKLKEAQDYAADRPWDKWCIYRVPRRLRDAHDSKVYVPQTVSIGPYHLADEQVRSVDRHKWIALHRTLERSGKDLRVYIDSIKEVEQKARSCYQQDVGHLSSYQFVEMMVLDGCFIIELFRCSPKAGKSRHLEIPVIFNQRTMDDILLDMVMLENQIPLFVLDRLLELDCIAAGNGNDQQKEQATTLALNLFNPEWFTGASLSMIELDDLKSSLQGKDCFHVLDVFRWSLLLRGPQKKSIYIHGVLRRIFDKIQPRYLTRWLQANKLSNRKAKHRQVIHNVTHLREAGVKFRKRDTKCFWDIKFKNGVLEIPPIWIQDGTMSILLNLAAFEHCHLKNISEAVIASYAVFMECLIKSPEDVSYLHRHGIIQHLLGHDSEVVDMFKSVSREMLVDPYSGLYANLAQEVNAYCNKRRNRWRASLIHKHFNNPWRVISLVAAVILLLLTATQTFYAIYSYNKPSSGKN